METPGTDDPNPTDEPAPPTPAPIPSPASAPRPPSGPTTSGIPVEPTREPVAVGDPTGGATATGSITTATPPLTPSNPPPTGSTPSGLSGAAISTTGGGSGGIGGDWPVQATDAIVNVVGAIRNNTTGRITTVARGVVFGLFAAILGGVLAVLLIVGVIRFLDEILPSSVWLPYLILGVVLVGAGALVFRKRNQPQPPTGNTKRS